MDNNSNQSTQDLAVKKRDIAAEKELEEMERQILEASQASSDDTSSTDQNSSDNQQSEEDVASEQESAPRESNHSESKVEEAKDDGTSDADNTDDGEDVDVSQLSERAQKRFRKLSEERNRLRNELLEEKRRRLLASQSINIGYQEQSNIGSGLPWDQPTEISIEDYERAVEQKAEQKARKAVQAELAKEKMLETIHNDSRWAESTYEELNPESERFDKELSLDIASDFKIIHQNNPNTRLKDFVENRMKYKAKWANEGRSQITTKVVRESASQALGPTVGMKKVEPVTIESKIKGAKTLAELEALEEELL